MQKPQLKSISYVFVYQKNLDAKEFPFKAEVLKTKYQRVYLRWELAHGGFTEQWVNRGCCSVTINKVLPVKPKVIIT